jgi:hypothetical protein
LWKGGRKKSIQHSAISIQPRRFTAKDAKTAKEPEDNRVSSMIRTLTTLTTAALATFAPFAVQFLWLSAEC